MKSSGGLTRGRGITESVLTRWTLGMIHLHNICEEVEKYCNITSVTSEQHVDMRPSRIARDNEDVEKLMQWFSQHIPFPINDVLMSISIGVVGTADVNCHLSHELGCEQGRPEGGANGATAQGPATLKAVDGFCKIH
ncbi:hypothetical protein AVEN_9374-1 [Araneus ventricosus]|uniref:Uncharacterized protein n=1 Tax=Araneus ventricosus TaxID=182803 RepID=A0A4Y2DJ26_ARAVE|nr:hypothetical protein AVEN_9374-1 [Araneus ventricosus]